MEITEFKERPNTHQTHFEDLVLLGSDGLGELNDKIEKFMTELSGKDTGLNTTTKIDGSPAVVCFSKFPGYPDNSICLKSFITSNKNCLSSSEEIQAKYGDRPDMAEKLLYCLQLAKCIPENEAWQGDCLYTKGDLKEVEIHGKDYLTFHPNKIIYAFSEDNPTYNTIKNSDFGICFHTIYKPAAEGKKTQTFRVDAKRLNNVPENIYVMSPALNKSTNKADYNIDEVLGQYDELKKIESQLLSNSDYEDLCDNSVFMSYWNTFENANLSDKRAVNINVDTFFDELVDYIKGKQQAAYDKKMSTLKTDKGKQKATYQFNADVIEMEDILQTNKEVIILLVKALNLAANIKMNLWNGFKKADQGYNTFYKSKSKGYIPADMEGAAMSDSEGNIVKIVDRSTFSFANRSDDIIGGWER